MREILFRGKRIDNGEWAYGNFVMDATEQVQREKIPLEPILADGFIRWYDLAQQKIIMHEVDRATIGQYTGLTDKNGVKIFEGDVIKHFNNLNSPDLYDVGTVLWDAHRCRFYRTSEQAVNKKYIAIGNECNYEVIGNIHDNPELMGGNENE